MGYYTCRLYESSNSNRPFSSQQRIANIHVLSILHTITMEGSMKHAGLSVTAGIFGFLVAVASVALPAGSAIADGGFRGASYVTTVKDSNGDFASRGVITLHADQTMSAIDSGQGGPTFFFSSQLGSWASSSTGRAVGRTIDFDYPNSDGGADVARLDYTIRFEHSGHQIIGTIILTTFPLQANPLDGGGTVAGTFTFSGNLITP
jgi:hypothetical protein